MRLVVCEYAMPSRTGVTTNRFRVVVDQEDGVVRRYFVEFLGKDATDVPRWEPAYKDHDWEDVLGQHVAGVVRHLTRMYEGSEVAS
jgi:hypothetical protein